MQAQSTPRQSAAAIMNALALPFSFASSPSPTSTPAASAPQTLAAVTEGAAPGGAEASATEAAQDEPQQADAAGVRSVIELLKAGAVQSGDAVQPHAPSASPSAAHDQGRTGLLNPPGFPLLRTSKSLIMAGHAPVQWYQSTLGDWKMSGFPRYGPWLYRVKSLRPWGPDGAVLPCP